ncbi:hypothetical protein V5J35_004384 [Endozoicomonas sp. NE40]|uniref:Uncharacterized protein n=1 Tax=Endozoicomonas lisbonensis TaxID=3120522 RepID=A0ABV2SN49_9GAMM
MIGYFKSNSDPSRLIMTKGRIKQLLFTQPSSTVNLSVSVALTAGLNALKYGCNALTKPNTHGGDTQSAVILLHHIQQST